MARPEREAAIAELEDLFRSSSSVLLTEYRGLSVTQLKELRRSLAGHATYHVAKNTLANIAAQRAEYVDLSEELVGPTAIAFVTGEAAEAAKALRDFATANERLVIKGGVLDGAKLDAAGVSQLASLESREVLLGRAAGGLKALLYHAAYLFTAPATQAARTVEALREKQAADAEA